MNKEISILRCIMTFFLKVTKSLSISRWLIGKDPDNESIFLSNHNKTRFINYHTLLECYLAVWFLAEIVLIVIFPSGKYCSFAGGLVITILAAIRLVELFGAELHIIANRRNKDLELSYRKIIIGLMCYIEGMLIFCLIYMGLYTVLNCENLFSIKKGLSISSISILYFSISNYTTTGFGDITALHPAIIILSSLESIFGVLFLAFFISGLVARAFSTSDQPLSPSVFSRDEGRGGQDKGPQ